MLKRPDVTVNVDNVLKLADVIESLDDFEENLNVNVADMLLDTCPVIPQLFSMQYHHGLIESDEGGCGTVGCIYGVAVSLFGKNSESKLNLTFKQANELYYPNSYRSKGYTAKDAAKVLRHLALTNEVDWSITGK